MKDKIHDGIAPGVVAHVPTRFGDPALEQQTPGGVEQRGLTAGHGSKKFGLNADTTQTSPGLPWHHARGWSVPIPWEIPWAL
jgi:hypothetical protein